MHEKIITLVTPVFFLLIFVELVTGIRRGRNTYRLNDSINSLSLGILSQVSGVFMTLLRIGIYGWLVEHVALWRLPADSIWVWVTGLLLYDFCYYWLHRMGHKVNVLWAAHVVHHQSEQYNLSTALRQTSSGALLGWIFYLPMAVLGYPLKVFVIVGLIDLLYQFWVHTEQVGRLGWFDRVFVSPSNHRVHHAVNDIYLDKNYGGILILWDRLFGTFIDERDDEKIVYGTRSPLRSWNPVWANVEVYRAILQDAWRARRWRDKLRIWFMRPGWKPADVAERFPSGPFDIGRPAYDPPLAPGARYYCLVQFTAVLLITTHFLTGYNAMPPAQLAAYAAWLALSLWLLGGLMEGRRFYTAGEALRLMLTGGGVLAGGGWFGPTPLPLPAQAAIAIAALVSLLGLRRLFKHPSPMHGHLSHQ